MRNIKVDFDKHVHASTLHALLGFLCKDCDGDVIVAITDKRNGRCLWNK